MNKLVERLKNGLITENPTFVQVLAMCPTLAVTTSAKNAVGMGIATLVVLIFSNAMISAVRKFIPDKIRIPGYIVIIASFVTIIEMVMEAYLPALYTALGIFIPLIVVNCILLGRAEAFASKNGILASLFDGLGMGVGYTLALSTLAIIREVIGAGTILGYPLFGPNYQPALIMILPPGAFITLGCVLAFLNKMQEKKAS